MKQNYAALGLACRLSPSLKHSKEGRKLVKAEMARQQEWQEKARAAAAKAGQGDEADEAGEEELQEGDFEAAEEPAGHARRTGSKSTKTDIHVKKRDYTELFPGVFPSKDAAPTPTIAKLRGDDVGIMRRLIKKYGDDVEKMFRDVGLNYMQWSKSELKKKC